MRNPSAAGLRVLWWGDFGVNTGFGKVGHAFGDRLVQRGFDVRALAINWPGDHDLPTAVKLFNPMRYNQGDRYGAGRLGELCSRPRPDGWLPDVLVAYNDLPILEVGLASVPFTMPVLTYFPVDCANLPSHWLRPLRRGDVNVTFSRFAQEELLRADDTLTDVELIYHGIQHDVFRPLSPQAPGFIRPSLAAPAVCVQSRAEARAVLGVADRFVVLWADRNSLRKNAHDFLKAMAPFVQRHPETLLLFHCVAADEGGDLRNWIERYGLYNHVRFVDGLDTYLGRWETELNVIYNAADLRVSTSLGEGFGLHTGEAAAAGLAQVLPDSTCFREVGGPGAVYVPATDPYTSPRNVDLFRPNVAAITAAVEALYQDQAFRERVGRAGRAHVLEHFDWDRLTDQFAGAIERAAAVRRTAQLVG